MIYSNAYTALSTIHFETLLLKAWATFRSCSAIYLLRTNGLLTVHFVSLLLMAHNCSLSASACTLCLQSKRLVKNWPWFNYTNCAQITSLNSSTKSISLIVLLVDFPLILRCMQRDLRTIIKSLMAHFIISDLFK